MDGMISYRQPNGTSAMPTHYHSKSQGLMAIKDMNDFHLSAAIAKLATAPGTSTTLAALRAEQARRT
jgi:hypothetical protein